jgi:hypothetical protein
LDTLASVYIGYTLQNQVAVNQNTQEYIDKQLDEIMVIIDSLEGVVEAFKDQRGILDLEVEERQAFDKMNNAELLISALKLRRSGLQNLETFLERARLEHHSAYEPIGGRRSISE